MQKDSHKCHSIMKMEVSFSNIIIHFILFWHSHLTSSNKLTFKTQLSKEMTPEKLSRWYYVCPKHSTYHMVEYTAIFPSQSAAMHERLKHLHHISCLSQPLLVTHWQSESKFLKNYGGGPVTTCMLEPKRGLGECWANADGAVHSSSSHVAKECQLTEFEAGCLLWKASVSTNRTGAFWNSRGV